MYPTLHSQTLRAKSALTLAALAALTLPCAPQVARAQTTTTSGATTTPDAPPVTSSAYVLAPFDQIDITVQGHDEANKSVQVLTDGTISYQMVGSIKASGMTVASLTKLITKSLSEYYNDPQVTVSVRESHVQKITVSGIARTPGLYDYRPGMTLLELVGQSGGSAQAPELTGLTLITHKNGATASTPIDLVALNNGDLTQNPVLSPGDTLLFTPRDPAKAEVQIIGQVQKPGQYPVMRQGATLISILTEAGGATQGAALTKVQLVRNGKTYTYNLHPTLYNIDDPSGQIQIYAGDVINVPFNNNKIAIQGEVRQPTIYTVPDGEPFTLSTALAAAGGPTTEGDKKQIGLFRLGKDNQRHFIELNMEDFYKGRNSQQTTRLADVPLQDKDIIVVPTRNHGRSVVDYISAVPGFYYISQLLGGPTRL